MPHAPQDYEDFYTRRMYRRLCDTFNRPIASAPDAWFDLCERRECATPAAPPRLPPSSSPLRHAIHADRAVAPAHPGRAA